MKTSNLFFYSLKLLSILSMTFSTLASAKVITGNLKYNIQQALDKSETLDPPPSSKVASITITPQMVMNFAETSFLSEIHYIALFKNSKDFDEYEKVKKEYLENFYEKSLKLITYYTAVELKASDRSQLSTNNFFFPEEVLIKAVARFERKKLSSFTQTKGNNESPPVQFAKELIKKGFPHLSHEKPINVYQRWLSINTKKIKAELRKKSIKRWELVNLQHQPSLKTNGPASVKAAHNKIKDLFQLKLEDKKLTIGEIQTVMKESPELFLIVNNLEKYKLQNLSLKSVNKMHPNFKSTLSRKLNIKINSNSIQDDVWRFSSEVKALKSKYSSSQLVDLYSEQLKVFKGRSGQYANLILSQLYLGAHLSKESQKLIDSNNVEIEVSSFISKFYSALIQDLNISLSQAELNTYLSSLFYKELKDHRFPSIDKSTPYISQILALNLTSVQFELANILNSFKVTMKLEVLPLQNKKSYEKIKAYITQKEIHQAKEQSKKTFLLNSFSGDISFFNNSDHIENDEAINYLLSFKELKEVRKVKMSLLSADLYNLKKYKGVDNSTPSKESKVSALSNSHTNRNIFSNYWQSFDRKTKAIILNGAIIGIITTVGIFDWDYGSNGKFDINSEGFFSKKDGGGPDKTGHFYSTYAISEIVNGFYKSWGYTEKNSNLYSSISAWMIMMWMEIGDGTSVEHGFSYEDIVANTLGALSGYALRKYPKLDELIDIRAEHSFKPEKVDVTIDYNQLKYRLIFKGSGLSNADYLKYLELGLVYYVRPPGVETPSGSRYHSRHFGVSLGLNIPLILREKGYHKTSTVLRYIQLPGTSFDNTFNLNSL